jgi:hypothetical protein
MHKGHLLTHHGIYEADLPHIGRTEVAHVCSECLTALTKGKMPKYALANELDFGYVFAQLPVPTIVEECLFALCKARMYILKLTSHSVGPPSTQQRALKGHVICFPQKTEKIFHALPHSVTDLVDSIQVVFLGGNTSLNAIRERMKRCKLLEVRKRVIEVWLEMLCRDNHFYSGVHIDVRCVDLCVVCVSIHFLLTILAGIFLICHSVEFLILSWIP